MKSSRVTVWTPDKEAVLRARYATEGPEPIAADLGLTPCAIRSKAKKLCLKEGTRSPRWTDEEDALLLAHYQQLTINQLAALIGRSYNAIQSRLQVKGLELQRKWTEHEDQDLARLWQAGNGAKALEEYFGRTFAAIARRASLLGVKRPIEPKVWTPAKREYLRQHYATQSNADLARHFNVSVTSICKQAKKMGLQKPADMRVAAQLQTKRIKAKAKVQRAAAPKLEPKPKPDYRAEKRKPCGLERKAGAVKAKPAPAPSTPWYRYPRGSAEYKAGEAAYFASKQARQGVDTYGRPVTIYSNRL